MKLGTFNQRPDGSLTGKIATLGGLRAELTIWPVEEKNGEKSPDYRVTLSRTSAEAGAGWNRKSQQDADYIAITLDAPEFAEPINAALFPGEEAYALVWNRR